MNVIVRTPIVSINAAASLQQVGRPFAAALEDRARARPSLEHVRGLVLDVLLIHAELAEDLSRPTPRSKSPLVSARSALNHSQWAQANWAERVQLFAHALCSALDAIPPSRMTDSERKALKLDVVTTRESLASTEPQDLAAVQPLTSPVIRLSTSSASIAAEIACEDKWPLKPGRSHFDESLEWLRRMPQMKSVTLYRREGNIIDYWELSTEGFLIIERAGRYGEKGRISIGIADSNETLIWEHANRLKAARARGFHHAHNESFTTLGVAYESGLIADNHDLRAEIQSALLLFGLGRFDGETTRRSEVIFVCSVLDLEIARRVLANQLNDPRLPVILWIKRLRVSSA
ncbi:MAG: hypothetical protein HXY22_08645 [Alphaproteobacteria bacterium]|nr:hypothetical protein [Alphaproteobacteria bacterium]